MLVALPDMADAKTDFQIRILIPFRLLCCLTSTGRILEANAQALELLGAAAPGAQLARLVEGLGGQCATGWRMWPQGECRQSQRWCRCATMKNGSFVYPSTRARRG